MKTRTITKIASILFALVIIFQYIKPIELKAHQPQWQYAKSVSVYFDHDNGCIYYVESCTSEPGNQCTEPTGNFRTCLTPL